MNCKASQEKLNGTRLALFLAFTLTISAFFWLILWRTGGLVNSPTLSLLPGLKLASIILAFGLMFAPGFANLLTRLTTGEGLADLGLRPLNRRHGGLYWLIAWFLPALLCTLGAVLYFLIFPRDFDSQLAGYRAQLAVLTGTPVSVSQAWVQALLEIFQAILIAPLLNAFFTFGEEFGWRGYLLPKLLPLGRRKAVFLSSLIWGLWHAPLIAMGHNYGFGYPGAPWSGIAMMVFFCLGMGALLSFLTFKEGSIWPAAIAHGALNGIASGVLIYLAVPARPLLGPACVGLVGGAFFTLLATLLYLHPKGFTPGQAKSPWQSAPIADVPLAEESRANEDEQKLP